MRDQRLYLIEILEDGYSGDVSPLYPTGDMLTITQGQIDDDELVALRGSQATLSLLCVDDGDPYTELFSTDPMRYMLRVRVSRGLRWMNYWQGYLSSSSYSQAYALPPYGVTLKAVDGLALLKDIPYLKDDGTRYEGVASLSTIISNVMAHITSTKVIYMPIAPISPEQSGHTLDAIGVDAAALYSSFDKQDVPSCYDVLEAVLKTMGLQIFLSYGMWRVRSIASLITTNREIIDTSINNGGESIPLFVNDGSDKGVSVSATLSLLAPYKSMNVERPEPEEAEDMSTSMLDGKRWHKIVGTFSLNLWTKGDDYLRMQVSQPKRNAKNYYGAYYIVDTPISSADNLQISASIDLYSLWHQEKSVRIGLYMQDVNDADTGAWLNSSIIGSINEDGLFEFPHNVYAWRTDESKWGKVTGADADDFYLTTTTEVKIAPSGYQPFAIPCPISRLVQTQVSASANGMPPSGTYKLIVILVGPKGDVMPPVEIRAPQISISQGEIVDDVFFTSADISNEGLGSISYNQHFGDSWVTLGTGSRLEAPLINVTSNSTIHSFVAPAKRALLADMMATDIQHLRGDVARQLEGEVYVDHFLDLDALWHDRDGRTYYTNYIKRLVRRGLYYLQLRQIPTRKSVDGRSVSIYAIDKIVGLDTSAYMAVSNSRYLYRYDIMSDEVIKVLDVPTSTYPLTLNEGQRCVSVITFDSVWYTLIAYDTHGNELSRIEHANGLVTFGQPYYDVVFRSARFDANINVWTLVGGDDTVTYTQMISHDGLDLGRSVYSLSATSATEFRLMPNGYTFISAPSGTSSYQSYWHNNAAHKTGVAVLWEQNIKIVAANEVYLMLATAGKIALYARTDTMMGIADTPLIEEGDSYWSFVDMNNALVLLRSVDGTAAKVYDGRTGEVHELPSAMLSADTLLWLSSDYVYAATRNGASYTITSIQVLPRSGSAATSGYLQTNEGLNIITAENEAILLAAVDGGASGSETDGYRLSFTGDEVEKRLKLAGTAYQKPITGIPFKDIDKDAFVPIDGEGDGLVGASDLRTKLNLKILSDE